MDKSCKPDLTEIEENNVSNTYISLNPSIEFLELLAKVQKQFYDYLPGEISKKIAWVDPINFTLVLRFMGKIPFSFLEYVRDNLTVLVSELYGFNLNISGMKTFHQQDGKPRVLSLHFEESEKLRVFKEKIEKKLNDGGLDSDPVKVVPHITIARIPENIEPIMAKIENFQFKFPDFLKFNDLSLVVGGENLYGKPHNIFQRFLLGKDQLKSGNLKESIDEEKLDSLLEKYQELEIIKLIDITDKSNKNVVYTDDENKNIDPKNFIKPNQSTQKTYNNILNDKGPKSGNRNRKVRGRQNDNAKGFRPQINENKKRVPQGTNKKQITKPKDGDNK
jgi:2'-5' RNA ligase